MKDGKIKESQLSSSSSMKTELNKTGNCPHFSRPGSVGVFMVEDGMLHYDRNNFLQVDFRSKTKVEMVKNQSHFSLYIHTYILYCIAPPWGLFRHTEIKKIKDKIFTIKKKNKRKKKSEKGGIVEIKFAIKIIIFIKGIYKFNICLKILYLKRFRSFVIKELRPTEGRRSLPCF